MNQDQDDILAAVEKVHEGRISTHYEGCWKYHAGCLAFILRKFDDE